MTEEPIATPSVDPAYEPLLAARGQFVKALFDAMNEVPDLEDKFPPILLNRFDVTTDFITEMVLAEQVERDIDPQLLAAQFFTFVQAVIRSLEFQSGMTRGV